MAAATAPERLIRCRAAAGSGKSTTLVARVSWLVEYQGVPPERLCVVTFSKKAAGELVARIDPTIGKRAFIGTLHALGLSILYRETPGIHVADEGVRRKLVRQVMQERKIDRKFAEVLGAIVRHKGRSEALEPWAVPVFMAYEAKLRAARFVDYDDMLILSERLLRERPAVRARWQRWEHILQDEAQDASALQWRLLQHLVGETGSLFVAADYSQAIYSWRGADPTLMLTGIDEMFGPFTDYPIATNYRSLPPIVALANRVIEGKPGALTMRPAREDGESPGVAWLLPAEDKADEAQQIVVALQVEHEAGRPWREMLVLVRCNAQNEALEAACLQAGVPVVVAGGQGFYGRREIRDVLAYLRLAQGWDVEALERVFNRPSRYLGAAFVAELERQGGWSALITEVGPPPRKDVSLRFSKAYMRRRLDDLIVDVWGLQGRYNRLTPVELVEHVLEKVGDEGYRAWLVGEEPSLEDEVRGENLDALVEAARTHATVADLLALAERCERRAEGQRKDGEGAVTLSTVHKQKGLESPLVVVAGLTSGVLPHRLAHLHPDPERRQAQIEEERRIAYVAVTRARDRLILSSWGPRSPYWADMGGPGDDDEEDDDAPTLTPCDDGTTDAEDEGWKCDREGRDAGEYSAARGASGGGARERLGADSDVDVDAARGGRGPAGRGARDRRPHGGV